MATKRVQVERLRPRTQEEVFNRPVDTYIRPAPVQEGELQKLSKFIDELTPRFLRHQQVEREQQKEEEKKQARELAETTTATYDDLVTKGEIGPEASPVFRFAFNETRGQVAGYTFIQEASEAYQRSNLPSATDASSYDDWYNQYYEDYVANNQDVLGKPGAYEKFSNIAGQARNNLLQSHLSSVNKNFVAASDTAYNNFVFAQAQQFDPQNPESVAAFTAALATKQGEMATHGGPTFKYSRLNTKTVDALVDYYRSNGFHYKGLEAAMTAVQGGTGSLAGTAYASTELAKARVEFATGRLKMDKEAEDWHDISVKRTTEAVEGIFFGEFSKGNFDIYETLAKIEQEHGPEMIMEFEKYYPDFRFKMEEMAEKWKVQNNTEPMGIPQQARLRRSLEQLPADERVSYVLKQASLGNITEPAVFDKMLSFATASSNANRSTVNLDATKDPVYKDFFEMEFKTRIDTVTGQMTKKLYHFQTSYYELFDQVDENGDRTWDTNTNASKLRLLNTLMTEINNATSNPNSIFGDLTNNPSNFLTPVTDPDGNHMIVGGNVVMEISNLNN